jgi:hypothetical protein
VVATAHPSKFDDSVPTPHWFADLPSHERFVTIDATTSELEHLIR